MSEKLEPKDIYSVELPGKGAAADLDLEGVPIPKGRIVRISSFYVIDLTTVNRSIRLGFRRGGSNYWFKRQNAGASSFGVCIDKNLILVEGEYPIGRVESAPSGDECWLIVRGEYIA